MSNHLKSCHISAKTSPKQHSFSMCILQYLWFLSFNHLALLWRMPSWLFEASFTAYFPFSRSSIWTHSLHEREMPMTLAMNKLSAHFGIICFIIHARKHSPHWEGSLFGWSPVELDWIWPNKKNVVNWLFRNCWIQTSKTGDLLKSNTYPNSECSLFKLSGWYNSLVFNEIELYELDKQLDIIDKLFIIGIPIDF